jgi:hypothetical protein
MSLPNVVIAGAPKCGTTSVFKYLSDHPEVCASKVKETYYFMDRDYPLYNKTRPSFHTDGLTGYASYFEHCSTTSARIVLEATPDYLYQRTALQVLPTLSPPITLIFMLRKPSDRVWSLYQFAQNNLAILPSDLTFRAFVEMVKEPKSTLLADRPILRDALEHSKYIRYLLPYQTRCKPGKIRVYIFENLRDNPKPFMQNLCLDLGLNADFYHTYPFVRENVSFRAKSQSLHRIKRLLVRVLPKELEKRSPRIKRLYHKLNVEPAIGKSAKDIECLSELDIEFQPYNERLSREMSIDLSCWQ